MSGPVRSKRRLSLAGEFKKSVKAGPRVWLIAGGAIVCLLGLPLLNHLLSLLATFAVGVGLLFVAPVIISAVAGGVLAYLRKRMVVRVFTPGSEGSASTSSTTGLASSGARDMRQAEVIKVKTIGIP